MKLELSELINQQGIVPLYYSADAEVSIDLMRALYAGGIRTTEYADRGDRALKNFREMRKVCDAELPGMRLGIGTIKTAESARIYIDEGAEFLEHSACAPFFILGRVREWCWCRGPKWPGTGSGSCRTGEPNRRAPTR